MAIGIYVITDKRTGKFYVGSSQDLRKRIERHFNELKDNKHHNKTFQDLWNKGGDFFASELELNNREEAYELEQELITKNINNVLLINIGTGVRGGDNLTRNPDRDAILRKMTHSLRSRMEILLPHERKLLFGRAGALNGMYGKTHTPEARAKMSKANIGNKYSLGRKASEETRRKISIVASKRVGVKNHFYGKKHSEVTKKRIALAKLGTCPTNIRPVVIDGIVYKSLAEAGRQLRIPVPTVLFRVRSPNKKFSEYKFAVVMPND